MVVFTCNNCGETLQKPRVAKHYQFQCRTAAFLTCVDCFKDFRGKEYTTHTKCITEAERYGGKNYVPKASANKGERKQQEWINVISNLLESAPDLSDVERGFLNSLSRYDNIPRKKAKFLNFIRTAMGQRTNMQVVESVWTKMEEAHKNSMQSAAKTKEPENGNAKQSKDANEENGNESVSKETQENSIAENQNNENICRESQDDDHQNKNNESNGGNNEEEKVQSSAKRKKSKKRAVNEIAEEQNEEPVSIKKRKNSGVLSESSMNHCEDATEKTSFDWKNTILSIVQSKGEVSIKKLQKKVISQYMSHCSDEVTHEKASAKFNKKLKKVAEIIVSEDKVKLA